MMMVLLSIIITQQYKRSVFYFIIMQAVKPCAQHEAKQITLVCLSPECPGPRLFCTECVVSHLKHCVISYQELEHNSAQLNQISFAQAQQIKEKFQHVRQSIEKCLALAEERITKKLLPMTSFGIVPRIDTLEMQQLLGFVGELGENERMVGLLREAESIQKEKQRQETDMSRLDKCMQELSASMMAGINKFMADASNLHGQSKQKSPIKKPSSLLSHFQLQMINSNYFTFSKTHKPSNYDVDLTGLSITRKTSAASGLSMYALTERPLQKQHNCISFQIVKQYDRFMYVGVCDRASFQHNSYKGNLYELGKKMYAIRQGLKVNDKGFTLHNSNKTYSNQQVVPWDFAVNDVITLQLEPEKNTLGFWKNGSDRFQMPLDKETMQFYPFVGMKYEHDCIRIVENPKLANQKKQKSAIFKLFNAS